MEGIKPQDSSLNPDNRVKRSVNVDAKEGVSETDKMEIFHTFNDATNKLKEEWGHPEAERLTIIIMNEEAYRAHQKDGPMTWPVNFLVRGRGTTENPDKRYILCNTEIFRATKDPGEQIKHEAAHLIIEQLVGDSEAYKGCYLLEEGLASYDGATEKLKERLKEEGKSFKDIKNPLGYKSMDDVRKNDNEAFTESIDYLTMFSFGEFLKERLGAKGSIELYKATSKHNSIEEAYKEVTGKDFSELLEKWQETLMTPEELKEKYNQAVANFFNLAVNPDVKIVIFESMDDIKNAYNKYSKERFEERAAAGFPVPKGGPKEAQSYLKGFNPDGELWNEIWVVRSGVPDEEGRIMGERDFRARIKHEITHHYIKALNEKRGGMDNGSASWLEEGVCFHLAGQFPKKEPDTITPEMLENLSSTLNAEKFAVGYKLVRLILKEHGKDKLFELLRIIESKKLTDEMKRLFEWPVV